MAWVPRPYFAPAGAVQRRRAAGKRGVGKLILRDLLYTMIPRELVDRPKMGFSVPIASWLRGELRDWAQDLLSETRIRRQGLFNAAVIQDVLTEHLSGRRDWHAKLWDVLMFQSWYDANFKND